MEQNQKMLKVVGIYLVYFLYSQLASFFANTITLLNGKVMYLIFDIFFLGFIWFLYYKNLNKDWAQIKKDYNLKKIGLAILIFIVGSFVINMVIGLISDTFFPGIDMDANTESIHALAKVSPIYAIFKAMIFGVIAEEILYRESLSDLIKNDMMFILISSIIYTILPFIFNGSGVSVMNLLTYFIPSLFISYLYVKNDRNIIVVMIVKFVYNLIPLTLLIVELLK